MERNGEFLSAVTAASPLSHGATDISFTKK
jgi:hypothetical protein